LQENKGDNMYKKITHYIIEEHFDGANAIVDKMFAETGNNVANTTVTTTTTTTETPEEGLKKSS